MSRRKRTSGHRDDVGYGRPPREYQFKPGQSGNKRGRPKGSKNEATIIEELSSRKVEVRQNGREKKITLLEAIWLRCAEDALKGNLKAAAFLLNRIKQLEPSSEQPANDVPDMDDRKVLEFYAQQLQQQFKRQGESE